MTYVTFLKYRHSLRDDLVLLN